MNTIDAVKNYYGKVLKKSQDMKSGLCNSSEPPPPYLRRLIRNIAGEICEKFFGCGCPLPPGVEGCRVLDLGCGTGRDVYLASQLVGAEGHVTGVDMTEEQLEVAQRFLGEQMRRFRYPKANVEFLNGYIEDLKSLGIEDDSFDVVISDNTINLSPAKPRVFAEIMRVLRPGGELYFCDVFASRRVPPELGEDPMLVGECLAGAMYLPDCRRMLREAGCADVRIVSERKITIENREILARSGTIEFRAITLRAFKIAGLEDTQEDYGQTAFYLGTLAENPKLFLVDHEQAFMPAVARRVSGNTATMLSETRFARHFHVNGDRRFHYGPFHTISEGGPPLAAGEEWSQRKETLTMMATMQMPSMMGDQQAGAMRPEMAQQMMPGMMNLMECCKQTMNMCGMMQNACQEMMGCCRQATSTGGPLAARGNEMIGCCNQMVSCCNEMTGCCRQMMSDPSAMANNMMPMANCCMNMMACCNMMMACCRNMMMMPMMAQMMPQMQQMMQPMMSAMAQIMPCCQTMMSCCTQMMGCCMMMINCCRQMMMPGMMGGMSGMSGMGNMMGNMMPGMMGGMGSMSGMGNMGGMGSMGGMGGGMMPGMMGGMGSMGNMMPGMMGGMSGMGNMMPGMMGGMSGGMSGGMGSMGGMGGGMSNMMPNMMRSMMNPMMSSMMGQESSNYSI